MAGDDLIASYARELSEQLGGRAVTISAEALDHLMESVDRRMSRGTDASQAMREAVAAFGTPAEVAASYVAAGVGVPTTFTRRAGLAALIGAALVIGGLATLLASVVAEWSHPWEGIPRTLGNAGAMAVVVGVVLSAVGTAGLLRRQGRVSGWPLVAVALMGFAAVTALVTWLVWLWVTALALGGWILAVRLRRAGLAPRRAVLRSGLGAAVAGTIPWLLVATRSIEGRVLNFELLQLGLALGLTIWASGVGSLGWWLLRDERSGEPGYVSPSFALTSAKPGSVA